MTIKMIRSTSRISMYGVILISDLGPPLVPTAILIGASFLSGAATATCRLPDKWSTPRSHGRALSEDVRTEIRHTHAVGIRRWSDEHGVAAGGLCDFAAVGLERRLPSYFSFSF